MIDRKTLWFLLLLILAMAGVSLWRLSLLPDWTQVPFAGPRETHVRHGLFLFSQPLALLFVIATMAVQRWLVSGPAEALTARRRWTRPLMVGMGLITALMHALMITRSLGLGLSVNPEAVSRTMLVVIGIMVMVMGNGVPKLPTISKRIAALNLDPWKSARSRRFEGWLTVGFGFSQIVMAVLLPIRAVAPVSVILMLAFVAACCWHLFKLKREPSALR